MGSGNWIRRQQQQHQWWQQQRRFGVAAATAATGTEATAARGAGAWSWKRPAKQVAVIRCQVERAKRDKPPPARQERLPRNQGQRGLASKAGYRRPFFSSDGQERLGCVALFGGGGAPETLLRCGGSFEPSKR